MVLQIVHDLFYDSPTKPFTLMVWIDSYIHNLEIQCTITNYTSHSHNLLSGFHINTILAVWKSLFCSRPRTRCQTRYFSQPKKIIDRGNFLNKGVHDP